MTANEIATTLEKMCNKVGPFTDCDIDSEFLPHLLAWIGSDWQRLRIVLNATHDTGVRVGYDQAVWKLSLMKATADHRLQDRWLADMRSTDGAS